MERNIAWGLNNPYDELAAESLTLMTEEKESRFETLDENTIEETQDEEMERSTTDTDMEEGYETVRTQIVYHCAGVIRVTLLSSISLCAVD